MGRKVKDLTGMRFGRLTVIKFAGINKAGKSTFLCRCDCGTEKVISGHDLSRTTHPVRSCGCLNRETKIKPGDRFGRLTVIERSQSRASPSGQIHVMWRCRCDCGNETIVSGQSITSGNTKSCGCLHVDTVKSLYSDGTAPCKLKESARPRKTNTSGHTGVWFDSSKQLWCAEIMFKSKKHFLGRYKNFEDAAKAREKAEDEIFGKCLEGHPDREEIDLMSPPAQPDYVGKTFGGLRVLVVSEKRPGYGSRLECICTHCGKTVTRTWGAVRKSPLSCGCIRKSNSRDGSRTVEKICPVCGKTFLSYESHNQKTCSMECRDEYNQRNSKNWRFSAPDGQIFECSNLKKWATENYLLIDPNSTDPQLTASRFCNGLSNSKRAFYNPNGKWKSKSTNYKGWRYLPTTK